MSEKQNANELQLQLWPSSTESLHVHPCLCNCFTFQSWENFNSNKRKGSTRSLLVAGGVKGSRGIDGHSPQNRPSRFRSEGQEEEGEYVYITVSSTLTKGDGWQPPFHSRSLQNEFWIEYFLRREFLSLCLSHCLSPSILSFYLSLSLAARDRIETRNQELDTHHHYHHHHHHHYHHHHTPIEGAW